MENAVDQGFEEFLPGGSLAVLVEERFQLGGLSLSLHQEGNEEETDLKDPDDEDLVQHKLVFISLGVLREVQDEKTGTAREQEGEEQERFGDDGGLQVGLQQFVWVGGEYLQDLLPSKAEVNDLLGAVQRVRVDSYEGEVYRTVHLLCSNSALLYELLLDFVVFLDFVFHY